MQVKKSRIAIFHSIPINISTTMRYTHLLDAHKLAAVDRLEGLGG